MASDVQVEQRLTAVERAVLQIQQQLELVSFPPNWLEHLTGSFRDEAAFEKVIEYGREIRRSDRPAEDASDQM